MVAGCVGVSDDPHGDVEGRSTMREVMWEEFLAYRTAHPDADWGILIPVGGEGPERYFIPASAVGCERVSA